MISPFKQASWIWHGTPDVDLVNSFMQARRPFTLSRVPKRAEICLTADTSYRLYVNGKYVARGPARGFQESWPFDRVDIAPYLRKGKNVIAALVHNLGVPNFQYVHKGWAGFILAGKVGGNDISTGEDWKVRAAPGYIRVLARLSAQMGFQECFDARIDDDWLLSRYDDSEWRKPFAMATDRFLPWTSFEERGIALLEEKIIPPVGVISIARGRGKKGYQKPQNVVSAYCAEKRNWAGFGKHLKRSRQWASLTIRPTGKGKFVSYCIDFGHEVVGSPRLRVEGASGGEIIDLIGCEAVEGSAPVISDPRPSLDGIGVGSRLILGKGKTEHEVYTYWGFRYLVITARDIRKTLTLDIGLRTVGYPLGEKQNFECSSSRLNKIYDACVRTTQCCMLDAYVDCPWREQAQWWGDARIIAQNGLYLSSDARLLKRGIKQIGTQMLENGLTFGHAPTIAYNCVLPDYTLIWVMTHWDYYWQTGDIELFRSMQDQVHRALSYFEKSLSQTGLLPHDKKYWLLLDCSRLFKDGFSTLYNLMYLGALNNAARLFQIAGDRKASATYQRKANALSLAIRRQLFDKRGKKFHGGLTWNGKSVKEDDAQSYAWAILTDLIPKLNSDFAQRRLLPMIMGERKKGQVPDAFFMFYIFQALKKLGYAEEIVDCIDRWWGEMIVDRGLTTTEEHWDTAPGGGSWCHAWSAHPIVHFANLLLGVQQSEIAWKRIRFSPTFAAIDWARGIIPTPHGKIESKWEKKGDRVEVFLKIPKGITADIELPGLTSTVRGPCSKNLRVSVGTLDPL